MSNLNKVFLMGRLTRDPELRYTPQGTPVTELGLAINREYTAGTERRKETTFIEVTLWKRQAEVVCQYLKKGAPIFVEGRISQDSWETPDGQKRSRMRVVAENFQFIGPRQGSDASSQGGAGDESGAAPSGRAFAGRQTSFGPGAGSRGDAGKALPAGAAGAYPSAAPPEEESFSGAPGGGSPGKEEESSPLGLDDSEIPF